MTDMTMRTLTVGGAISNGDLFITRQGANVTDSSITGTQIKTYVSASPTLVTPNLGTPSAGTLTNCTGLPISTGVSGLAAGIATFLATPSSANLAAAVTDETGTGALVFANAPTLITPALGTPSAAVLTNATGLPISTGVSGLGAGIATFLATPSSANLAAAVTDETGTGALVFANTPTLVTPVLGTPTSGTLTNCTGLPISTGVSGLAANIATFLATPSSANLASAVTDETGTGTLVFANTPTLVTPIIGAATGTSLSTTSTLQANSGTFQIGTNDAFGRPQIWNKNYLGVLRLGAWQADGDAVSNAAEGVVIYGRSLTDQPISPTDGGLMLLSASNSPFGEIWQMSMFTIDSTLPAYAGGGNWYSLNTTNLYYANNAGVNVFSVDRATGNTIVGGTLNVTGAITGTSATQAAEDNSTKIATTAYVDRNNVSQTIHVSKSGSDATGTGSENAPYLTVQKAATVIGSAASNAEFNDATKRFYRVIVDGGVYTETVTFGTRPFIDLDLRSAMITGDVIAHYDQGAIFGAGLQAPKFCIMGDDLRPQVGASPVTGITGNVRIQSTSGSSLIFNLMIKNAGVTGDITAEENGGGGLLLGCFLERMTYGGDVKLLGASSALTLYAQNMNYSGSNSAGGVLNALVYQISNTRFTRPVVTNASNSASRWFNTQFVAGANDFTGTTQTVSADANTIESFTANVPSPGSTTFTRLDTFRGIGGTALVNQGGTGQTSYTDGQLLIGNTTGNTLAKSTLTAGSGVTITNGSGTITIAATGSGGTVTSVDVSGGTTGLTTSGGPITGSGTITIAGTLGLANGGTNANLSATGGASQVLRQSSSGAAVTVSQLANTDITGLGTMSTQNSNNVNITGATQITGLPSPTGGSDAATKSYVDAATAGLSQKQSVRVIATTNQVGVYLNGAAGVGATFTYTALGTDTIDGVALLINDRVALEGQTSSFQNGIYKVTTLGVGAIAGILTRATDYDQPSEIQEGTYFVVEEGTTYAGTLWILTSASSPTIGTDAISFTELSVAPQTLTFTSDVTGTGAGTIALTVAKIQGTTVSGTTGTTNAVFSNSPTLVTPALGTPSALVLTNATGTPTSIGLANGTGLPLTTGVTGTLPFGNGGTGQTSYTDGQLLIGNTGTGGISKNTLTAGSGISITNGNGTISIAATGGGGTVTTTGAPASGNLTKFSGATSITNGDLSGDVTTSGTLVTAIAAIAGTTVSGTTGTTNVVFSNSPTLVTPALGTPSALVLTNATGTPTSIGLANGTGLPISTGVSGLAANIATFLATPSSANLAAAVTDETGTGALVFANTPTLVTPVLGTPTSGNLTNCTGYNANSLAGTTLNSGVTASSLTSFGSAPTLSSPIINTPNTKLKVTAKTADYTLLTTDSGQVFTNAGAAGTVNFTLPVAAAGLYYEIIATAAQTVALVADAGHTIRNGGSVTSSGGAFTSDATKGPVLIVKATSTTEWYVTSIVGSWTTS